MRTILRCHILRRNLLRRNIVRRGLGFLPLLATLTLVVAMTGTVLANSVHLKGGPHAALAFIDNGLTLTAAGELAGLGFQDLQVNLSATASPTAVCANNGNNQAPGQNPAPVTVTGSVAIPASAIKNGNAPFTVTTTPPTSPIPGAPDCPNPNWTETITDMAFTSATITVEQPVGTLVLTVTCTFSVQTADGAVPTGTVSCTSS
jgi:hypothetical protein